MNDENLETICQHYGIRKQIKKLSEEVFELQEAVIEMEALEDLGHVAEELADVMVLWEQIRLYHEVPIQVVQGIMKEKVERQLKRIENEKGRKVIPWLEKQKEFVSADFDDVWETADCDELTATLEKYSKDAIKEMCHAWYDKGIELERRKWLEKQGETYTKKDVDDAWVEGVCYARRELEKQDLQNLANSAKTCKSE